MTASASFEFFNEGLPVKSFTVFNEMRKKGEQVDVTIKCGNQNFRAHRLVLSAAIPYFRAMFGSNMSESNKQEILMKEIDPLALECLIDYAYVSRVKITEANVQSLFQTSEFLQITEVKDSCCRFLSERLSPDNAISIKVFAENANCTSLAASANTFIREKFDDVCDTADFLTMPFEFVSELIRRDDLHTESEEKVFEAVMKWVKADSERTSLLQELLAVVRMSFLTPEYLVTRVSKEELIRTSVPCRNLVEEAKDNCLLRNTALEQKNLAPKDRLWKTKSLKENVSSQIYAPRQNWRVICGLGEHRLHRSKNRDGWVNPYDGICNDD